MAYIGQGLPADVFAGFTIDKFTGTGVVSQTLTLSKAPLGETALLITIDELYKNQLMTLQYQEQHLQ